MNVPYASLSHTHKTHTRARKSDQNKQDKTLLKSRACLSNWQRQ